MIFNSVAFLVFFLVFFTLYALIKGKQFRVLLCLLGSYFFYGWWDWRFLSLIALSTVIDFVLGQKIHDEQDDVKRKRFLFLSIGANLGFLFFFKYFNFFIDSFVNVASTLGFSTSMSSLSIILPVGISFYTFQTMSYSIDIYRKKLKPESNFMVFATYVAFFPQLVAGPIVRAIDLLPQFHRDHKITLRRISIGLFLILLGYAKKVGIADSIAPLVDHAFANPENHSAFNLITIVVLYAFQIYCDFSGYSDIAIGLGKLMGYDFPINFNFPYIAKNFSDFWKRWHISLSSWLRDYLYISLGGNRKGAIMTQTNLMITMLVGGLWHGASWTFVVWGALHGGYLILQRLLQPVTNFIGKILPKSLNQLLAIIVTFTLVCFAWVFFRSQSFEQAETILTRIFAFDNMSPGSLKQKFQVIKCLFLVGLLFGCEVIYMSNRSYFEELILKTHWLRYLLFSIFIWIILLFGTFTGSNFIYFQF